MTSQGKAKEHRSHEAPAGILLRPGPLLDGGRLPSSSGAGLLHVVAYAAWDLMVVLTMIWGGEEITAKERQRQRCF